MSNRNPGVAIATLLLVSCASPAYPPSVPGYEIRSRLRDVSIGQTIEEVHQIVGTDAVRRRDRRDAPLPTPIRTIEFRGPAGQVRLEVYVVEVWAAEGCPDFHYMDIPVTYLNGRVVSKVWDDLEWNWRSWGGSLAGLRKAQDRFACAEDSVSSR